MRTFGLAKLLTSNWLRITGLAAALTLLAPTIVIAVAITVIGIPIAIALAFSPLVFMVSLGSALLHRVLDVGAMGYVIGAGATLLLLSVPPYFVNAELRARAAAFVAGDQGDMTSPPRVAVLAIRRDSGGWFRWFSNSEAPCDGLCMRLLLEGRVTRVIPFAGKPSEPIDPAMRFISFRMERRARCPHLKLSTDNEMPDYWTGTAKILSSYKAHARMQAEIGRGHCLIQETVPLAVANAVISHGVVHRGLSSKGAGLDPFADTLTAYRSSVHLRQGGSFNETYRRTQTKVYPLSFILAPTVDVGVELKGYAVLARHEERTNHEPGGYPERDFWLFVTAATGLAQPVRTGSVDGLRLIRPD
jgi:hypothetical protein